jgi:peptidoglycan/xylan/chitin deacetylase (PgdA/CDA1 family)
VKKALIRAGLEALYLSGGHILLRPFFGGVGAILTFRHVRPPRREPFQPNRSLEVTPEFLERVIQSVQRSGLEIVSLDEMHRRFVEADLGRRFACFTFDGGYRDSRIWAYPILKKYGVPFAIYVPTSFADRVGELWWRVLEAVIANNDRISLMVNGQGQRFDCGTTQEKKHVFAEIYRWLRTLPKSDEIRSVVRDLAARYSVDVAAINGLCMSWQEIADLARDPLVTIGANTVNYPILTKTSDDQAFAELKMGQAVIETAIGVKPEHCAYPFGEHDSVGVREFRLAAELNFKTGVTTHPGVLFPEYRDCLTALPRITVDGDYQHDRYIRVLVSGAATAVWNGFRDVATA